MDIGGLIESKTGGSAAFDMAMFDKGMSRLKASITTKANVFLPFNSSPRPMIVYLGLLKDNPCGEIFQNIDTVSGTCLTLPSPFFVFLSPKHAICFAK
jgi:hypothetical protein